MLDKWLSLTDVAVFGLIYFIWSTYYVIEQMGKSDRIQNYKDDIELIVRRLLDKHD